MKKIQKIMKDIKKENFKYIIYLNYFLLIENAFNYRYFKYFIYGFN